MITDNREFDTIGIYQGSKEVIDSATGKHEAEYLVNEYRMAFGLGWSIYHKLS